MEDVDPGGVGGGALVKGGDDATKDVTRHRRAWQGMRQEFDEVEVLAFGLGSCAS